MAVKNLYSLGLLRNGKVYLNKQNAEQAMLQSTPDLNDGVAKLCRYLGEDASGNTVVKTLIGFYANANEMEDNGGGQSYYTIIDLDGNAEDIEALKEDVNAINAIIGVGFSPKTLTDAINEINAKFGEGFDENHTVAQALQALKTALTTALTITLESSDDPDYAKVYTLKQGGNTVGTINIPKDIVVKEGKLVYGAWDGDEFHENTEEIHYGDEPAIKLVLNNDDVIYINAKDLVDVYTAGDGISVDNNTISIKLDEDGEAFLTNGPSGLKLQGVQAAIDKKADEERLEASDGISIASNKVKAVAAGYSAPAIKNPITVDKDGIKFANILDCGFFDDETEVVSTAEEINAITDPQNTDVFISGDGALNALTDKKTFKNIEVNDVDANQQIYLYAAESINVDGMEVTGTKGSTNGYVLYSAPSINISNLSIANGSTAYNVFEGDQTNQNLESLDAQYVTVDNPSLAHNVFNVYKPKNDAVINISDSKFNLTVDNSNILRVSNYANATGVTVNFENIDWTYENGLTKNDWRWAGLVIYQPAGGDEGLSGVLTAMKTWAFNFKNCKYNGVKVTENNFGEKNQVFYMYNVGGDGSIKDPVANGLTLNFE